MSKKVEFLNDCVGTDIETACMGADNQKIMLLENLRFHLAEEGKGEINGEKVKASKDEITAFR